VREFFRGWRCKAGLVTLVMAILLLVVWIRSIVIKDEMLIGLFVPTLLALIPLFLGTKALVTGIQTKGRHKLRRSFSIAIGISVVAVSLAIITYIFTVLPHLNEANDFLKKVQFDQHGWVAGRGFERPGRSATKGYNSNDAWLLLSKPRAAKSAKESNRA
jgi:amino acid transporter